MGRRPATALKDLYKGKDIYVLGSGPSMEHINPSFFKNKITIGANSVWKFYPVTYSLFKHKEFVKAAVEAKLEHRIVASLHDCGDLGQPLNEDPTVDFVFTHKRGRFEDLEKNFQDNLDAVGKDDDIFVSYSTITSCIHLAAYMGASTIIICGHDCGWIDKHSHVKNYAAHLVDFHKENFNNYHNMWFERVNQDSVRLKAKLKEVYGCEIYSINPFINFRLEGHTYDTTK